MFDGCLFVATAVKSASMGQYGLFLINFRGHLELAGAKKKGDETDMTENPERW